MTAARVNPPKPSPMTVEEFLDWPGDGTQTKYDLFEGAPRAMAPASPAHGIIQANVAGMLREHLRAAGRRCPVITEAPLIPRAGNNVNVRIPDVVVTCAPPGPKDRVVAEPLLIVEALSPSNENDTQVNVWSYLTIPSVREILLLRSDRVQAEVATREPDGDWPICRRIFIAGSTVTLESVGLSVPVEAFYDMTGLPDLSAPDDGPPAGATPTD